MVRLKPVDSSTFWKITDMKLPAEQDKFVAPNVLSLAQAWLSYDIARPMAIMNDDEVVGFVMLDWDDGERTVGVWRFMIAREHQRKGYGRKAMEELISLAREAGNIDLMYLDYVEGNTAARELYYSLGFRENGKVEDGEIIMTLPLTDAPKPGVTVADSDDADEIAALIRSESSAGTPIPEAMQNDITAAIENGLVKRVTLLGETIGLAIGGDALLSREHLQYLPEALKALGLSEAQQ